MIRKFLAGGITAALAAVMISLVAAGAGTVSANVNSVSIAPSAVDGGGETVATIDADEGNGDVRILATTGDIVACTDGASVACVLLPTVPPSGPLAPGSPDNRDITVDDAATNTDTLLVRWVAPDTGAATVTITALQNNVARSGTVTVRGGSALIEMFALRVANTSTSACQGEGIAVINATGTNVGNGGQNNAFLCTIVRDSAGNRLSQQPVVYTTTDGIITLLVDATGPSGEPADGSMIHAGSTGAPGDTATVTAASGGQSSTLQIHFGGNPASCTLTTDPTSVAVGGSARVIVDVRDSAGGPVPGGTTVAVAQANPGSGVNAQILGSPTITVQGKAEVSAIAAIEGAIALGATTPNGGGSTPITCTGTLTATGQVAPPDGGGTGGFTGVPPGPGSMALLVTSGEATAASLIDALGTAGCTVESLGVLTDGVWLMYINGAPAVVNAAFPATLPDLTPFFVRCA